MEKRWASGDEPLAVRVFHTEIVQLLNRSCVAFCMILQGVPLCSVPGLR